MRKNLVGTLCGARFFFPQVAHRQGIRDACEQKREAVWRLMAAYFLAIAYVGSAKLLKFNGA